MNNTTKETKHQKEGTIQQNGVNNATKGGTIQQKGGTIYQKEGTTQQKEGT